MPYEIKSNASYEDLIPWLQENVGDLQWSTPVTMWQGKGWSVNSIGLTLKGYDLKTRYLIRIDDSKLATICALRWS